MKISENSIFWWFNFACQESNFKIRMAITTILWLPKLLAVFYIFKPILSSEAQVPYSFLLYPTSAPIRTTRQSNSHASWPPSKLPILLQMGNPIFYSTSKINTEHPLDANGWCWYLVTNDTWTQKHKQVKRDVLGSTTHRAEGDYTSSRNGKLPLQDNKFFFQFFFIAIPSRQVVPRTSMKCMMNYPLNSHNAQNLSQWQESISSIRE